MRVAKRLLLVMAAAAVVSMFGMAAYAADDAGYSVKGKVVSIDPTGKTIVIDTSEGPKTVIFDEAFKGVNIGEISPGSTVDVTCIDVEGKACARSVKVISVSEAGKPTTTFEGEVVSIDPTGKTVVIKSEKGEEMTIKVGEAPVTMMSTGRGCEPAPIPFSQLEPGMKVSAECFDSGGLFCANKVTVVSPTVPAASAPLASSEVTGEVVSIDSTGNAVVVKTETGEKTLYYQRSTTGMKMNEIEVGKKIRAYCLDVEGKSCIKDIQTAE